MSTTEQPTQKPQDGLRTDLPREQWGSRECLFNPEAFEQTPGQMSMACHGDIPPKWLDELDPEMREYAEEFEVAHCPTCGGYLPDES